MDHDEDDKIIMLDQVYKDSLPMFNELCNLGLRYKKEQMSQRNAGPCAWQKTKRSA